MRSSLRDSPQSEPTKSLENSREVLSRDQWPLFGSNETPLPGSFNDESVVRGIVTDAIRKCAKSREQIADEMTVLVGAHITVRMLNSYTSEAAEQHRWPAQYTRAFCHVTGDWRLLHCITERAGFHLITAEESELLELGRQYLRQKIASERVSLLEKRLAGVEL